MKVITFNIRCVDDPNGNSVSERSPRLKKTLYKYGADLIGLQEATPKWLSHLQDDYGEKYEIFNYWRDDENKESCPILWRKDLYDCLDKGCFWLSDTPGTQSDGWDERKYKRICTWARLKDKRYGVIFNFLNTHFGFGDMCQVKSAELITEMVKSMNEKFSVVTGDFNMTPDKPAYKKMTEYFLDVNALTAKSLADTYHGYSKAGGGEHIDYCFVTPDGAIPKSSALITDMVDGKYPSDHYGIVTVLQPTTESYAY